MFCIDITLIAYSRGRLDFDTNLGLMQCVDFLNNVKKNRWANRSAQADVPCGIHEYDKKGSKIQATPENDCGEGGIPHGPPPTAVVLYV